MGTLLAPLTCTLIASNGHTTLHTPQYEHFLGSMSTFVVFTALPLPIAPNGPSAIASSGQASIQTPQPVHLSRSTTTLVLVVSSFCSTFSLLFSIFFV